LPVHSQNIWSNASIPYSKRNMSMRARDEWHRVTHPGTRIDK
jgi:hypothetical protein